MKSCNDNIIEKICDNYNNSNYSESAYRWVVPDINPFKLKEYQKNGDVSELLARVLINRRISIDDLKKIKEVDSFMLMLDEYIDRIVDLDIAAEKVLAELGKKNTKVFVYTDYDADGITSAGIVNDFFSNLFSYFALPKENLSIHVPERKDGYGLNQKWCEGLAAKKTDADNYLVITFDNGVTKNNEVECLLKAGIDVIVTDHHEPEAELPSCIVVDPKKDTERFGEELCGAGLAFLLCVKIYKLIKHELDKANLLAFSESLQRCLGLAAMGTIADMMNMTVFNLAMTRAGLAYLNCFEYIPVNCLRDSFNMVEITSKDIGFNIAACLNACGQMNLANLGYELLESFDKDESIIREKAEKIYKIYSKNKDITRKMKVLIQKEIDCGRFDDDKICIYPIAGIPYGIAGKLAQHISNSTNKPAIVLIEEDKEEMNGSARCASGNLDLLSILKPFVEKGEIKKANGHKSACGVVFYKEYLDTIAEHISDYISSLEESGEIELPQKKTLYIDKEISIDDICEKTYMELISMPYSMNFASPNLLISGTIERVSVSKSNPNNICYTLKDENTGKSVSIWAWNLYPKLYDATKHTAMKIVGNLNRFFQNPKTFTLDIVDMKFY